MRDALIKNYLPNKNSFFLCFSCGRLLVLNQVINFVKLFSTSILVLFSQAIRYFCSFVLPFNHLPVSNLRRFNLHCRYRNPS